MVPWGTGDPISSGYLNTLVLLTEKPPPLSVSIGGGSMSPNDSMICWDKKIRIAPYLICVFLSIPVRDALPSGCISWLPH